MEYMKKKLQIIVIKRRITPQTMQEKLTENLHIYFIYLHMYFKFLYVVMSK